MKPICFFNKKLPEKLGNIVGSNWDAVTIPPLGIFFKEKKKDVSEKLFKHELCHHYQGEKLKAAFYPILFLDYAVLGYTKSLLEKEAKEYAKNPLTKQEKSWWDSY